MALLGTALLAGPAHAQTAAPAATAAKPATSDSKAKSAPAKPAAAAKPAAKPAPKAAAAKPAAKPAKPAAKTAAQQKSSKPAAKAKSAAKAAPAAAKAAGAPPLQPVAVVAPGLNTTPPSAKDPALNPPELTPAPREPRLPLVEAPTPPSDADVSAVRRVLDVMRQGRRAEALTLADNISEPVTRKLAEWLVLRFDDNFAGYPRYARFIKANPTWPSVNLFRRRAEATLWQERADLATIRDYFSGGAASRATW